MSFVGAQAPNESKRNMATSKLTYFILISELVKVIPPTYIDYTTCGGETKQGLKTSYYLNEAEMKATAIIPVALR
jgi:hypothetical protein